MCRRRHATRSPSLPPSKAAAAASAAIRKSYRSGAPIARLRRARCGGPPMKWRLFSRRTRRLRRGNSTRAMADLPPPQGLRPVAVGYGSPCCRGFGRRGRAAFGSHDPGPVGREAHERRGTATAPAGPTRAPSDDQSPARRTAALKASVEAATRGANGQFAKIADRLDRVEHASSRTRREAHPVAEAVDRLEKQAAAAPAPAPATALPAPETTGCDRFGPASKRHRLQEAKQNEHMLQDWIVQ